MTDPPEAGVGPGRPRSGAVPRPLHVRARPRGRHRPHRPGPATPADVPAPHRDPACSPAPMLDGRGGLTPAPRPLRRPVPGRLGLGSVIVVPQGSQRLFRRHGFPDVVPLSVGESHRVGGLTVTATPARHSGRREPFGPPPRRWASCWRAAGSGSTSPATPTCSRRCAGWARRWTWRCCRSGAGAHGSARAPGPGARRGGRRPAAAAGRHTRCTGAASGCIGHCPAQARRRAPARRFAAEVRRPGATTEVRVLAPGTGLTQVD